MQSVLLPLSPSFVKASRLSKPLAFAANLMLLVRPVSTVASLA